MMNKPKVAFICVHNSCRSQIAEALGKHLAGDVFESYSAGTETKPQINQDDVRLRIEHIAASNTVFAYGEPYCAGGLLDHCMETEYGTIKWTSNV